MKDILMTIGVIALIILAFFIGKKCSDTTAKTTVDKWKAKVTVEEAKIKRYQKDVAILFSVIDSLESIELDERIVYLQVDSAIAADSTNAIREYRKGLQVLCYIPDETPTLTLREVGLGALNFQSLIGLKLALPVLYDKIHIRDTLISKQSTMLEIKDNIISLDSLTIDLLIKDKDSFWRNRFIFYIGVGANWNGTALAPGIQAGVGIRIVGND